MSARPYIVIDACIAGAWIFQEEFTPQALTVLNAIERFDVYPIVPARFYIEVLRVCQKKAGVGSTIPLSPERAWRRFQLVWELPMLPVNTSAYASVWQIAHNSAPDCSRRALRRAGAGMERAFMDA